MRNDTTVFIGLDVHKDSIVAAYSIGAGEIHDLGNVGVLQRDLDRLSTRMRSKGSRLRFVYDADPCGYGVYCHLTAKGFECTACAPSLLARKPGDRVKTGGSHINAPREPRTTAIHRCESSALRARARRV